MINFYRLLLIGCSLCGAYASAQELKQADFDQYTTADGLSDNSVTGVAQDSTGFLWISTLWGLNRFDGHRFVQFHSNADSNSLPSEDIWGMSWINDHQFALTGTGVHIVDTRTGRTRNLFIPYHDKKYQFKFNMVMNVKGDDAGNLYVLTRSGFYQYDRNDKLVFRYDYYSEAQTPVNHFFFGGDLFELDKSRLIILGIDGLHLYQKNTKTFSKMKPADCPAMAGFLDYPRSNYQIFQVRPGVFFLLKLSSDTLVYIDAAKNKNCVSILPVGPLNKQFGWRSKLLQLNDSTFFLSGQSSGLFRLHLNPRNGSVSASRKELDAYLCMGFLLDAEKRLVIATNKGLLRQHLEPLAVKVAVLPAELQQKFPNVKIANGFVTKDKIYAGTYEAGLAVFNKNDFRFEKNILLDKPGSGANYVTGIVRQASNELMLSTLNTPRVFNETFATSKAVVPEGWSVANDWASNIFHDSRNNIWINSRNLYRYNLASKQFTIIPPLPELLEVPVAIAEDGKGNIWLSCHGIARYNTISGVYDRYIDSFPFIKMPDKQVNALVIDGENTVWFNSRNNGLLSYNDQTKSIRHFSSKDGLPDDEVSSLMVLDKKLWIACHSGIACLDIETGVITKFGNEDGFPEGTILKHARFFYDSLSHQLYIGFSNVLAQFDPEKLFFKKSSPGVFIERIVVNGKNTHYLPGKNITTSWRERELTRVQSRRGRPDEPLRRGHP